MCGIAGVITKKENAVYDVFNLLAQLEHRGQDTAGALSMAGIVAVHKSPGPVTHAFELEKEEGVHQQLVGNLSLGHTRYPTIGGKDSGSRKRDAQPFYDIANDGTKIGIVENGHLVNDSSLREFLSAPVKGYWPGSDLTSSCDAVPIVRLLAYYFKQNGNNSEAIMHAVHTTMKKLVGAYTCAAAFSVQGKNYLVGFRDPQGIRPGVIGFREDSVAIASESIALQVDDYKNIRDIEPGEIIIINESLEITSKLLFSAEKRICPFEHVYFARASSVMNGLSVNDVRYRLGMLLAQQHLDLKEMIELVIPVPQTSIPAAMGFAKVMGLQPNFAIEKYSFGGRTFMKPTHEARLRAAKKSHVILPGIIEGKSVAVIDDSIVRGTVSKGIIAELRAVGASKVYFFSTWPPVKHPCDWGIDMHTYKELLAAYRTSEQVVEELGADAVHYMTIEGLKQVLTSAEGQAVTEALVKKGLFSPTILKTRLTQNNFCTACLNNEIPTPRQ